MRKFQAVIEAAAGGGAFVSIRFDVEQTFGKKRVPVRATIDGEPYRGSLVRMGPRGHLLGVLKDIRQRIGKDIGDQVDITIEEDDAPRTVVMPSRSAGRPGPHADRAGGLREAVVPAPA